MATELEVIEKAYGNCRKCYGKGYATQIENYSGGGDFLGDEGVSFKADFYLPCTCDRGVQITKMLEMQKTNITTAIYRVLDANWSRGLVREWALKSCRKCGQVDISVA